jgi:5'-3' exonuclease
MISLLDLDIVAYRAAASCEPNKSKSEREPLNVALLRCNDLMHRILHETQAESYKGFISGPDNFRYSIDPSYKANRKDVPRPEHLQQVREHLVVEWNAHVSDGIEADDNLGIHQSQGGGETIICSIDKDLLQIPGKHFNFVTNTFSEVNEQEGWANFYIQLIMGDRADNIQGYDGKMRQKVPQFLQPLIDDIKFEQSPLEMYKIVKDVYELGEEALFRNAQLLYIQRKEGDQFVIPE